MKLFNSTKVMQGKIPYNKIRWMSSTIILCLLLSLSADAYASEIKFKDTITLDRAISIALSRHPEIKAAEGSVEIGKSKVGQAEAGYYPGITINSGISRYSSTQSGGNSNISGSVNINQNIYDFGRRESKVDIERRNLDSYQLDLTYVKNQIIYTVKKSYYTVLQAKEWLFVTEEILRQYEKHLDRARGFYEAGLKPKYEVTKAELDLANGRVNWIKADNALKIAFTSLKNALSMPDAPDFDVKEEPLLLSDPVNVEVLINKAMLKRQDLLALIARQKAQERRIDFEKSGYYPSLTGSAGYGFSGDRTPFDKNWNVGATLTAPIFSGFQTKHLVNEARASLLVIQSQIESIRQRITLEVKQAYFNALEAKQRIKAAEVSMRYAEQNLDLALGRYNAGVGSPIEVTDGLSNYANAKNTYISARYDYNIALAEIERATGN